MDTAVGAILGALQALHASAQLVPKNRERLRGLVDRLEALEVPLRQLSERPRPGTSAVAGSCETLKTLDRLLVMVQRVARFVNDINAYSWWRSFWRASETSASIDTFHVDLDRMRGDLHLALISDELSKSAAAEAEARERERQRVEAEMRARAEAERKADEAKMAEQQKLLNNQRRLAEERLNSPFAKAIHSYIYNFAHLSALMQQPKLAKLFEKFAVAGMTEVVLGSGRTPSGSDSWGYVAPAPKETCLICDVITDDLISIVIVRCGATLKRLDIGCNYSNGVTNKTIDLILEHCPQLTDLTLPHHRGITIKGIRRLITHPNYANETLSVRFVGYPPTLETRDVEFAKYQLLRGGSQVFSAGETPDSGHL